MPKPVLGIILGAILGAFDGLTALLSGPEVAPMIVGIVIGSTLKGIVAGVIIGFVARKYDSLPLGLAVGGLVGLVLAFLVAAFPGESGQHYYAEIMIPGTLVGLILGYATQKLGSRPPRPAA
jgi:hypothetical protein